jgi:hypothetical protein
MKPTISIRYTLHTEHGIVGQRLARGEPLPDLNLSYPETPEGRAEAEKAKRKLQDYIERNHE